MPDSPTSEALTLSTGQAQIRINQDGTLIFPAEMTYAQFCDHLTVLKRVRNVYGQSLNQFVSFGMKRFGEAQVSRALEQLEFDLADASNAIAFGHAAEPVRALEGLSEEHKFVLGRQLPDNPEEQQRWAEQVIKHDLKPSELKTSIQRGEVVQREERAPGILSFESVASTFTQCRKQMSNALVKMKPDEKRRIAKILQPIADFVKEMEGAK